MQTCCCIIHAIDYSYSAFNEVLQLVINKIFEPFCQYLIHSLVILAHTYLGELPEILDQDHHLFVNLCTLLTSNYSYGRFCKLVDFQYHNLVLTMARWSNAYCRSCFRQCQCFDEKLTF